MAEYTIKNEDEVHIHLGLSSLDCELVSSDLSTTIDGARKLSLEVDLNPSTTTIISQDALSAKVLILEKIAGETISALSLLYLHTQSVVKLADNGLESTGYVVGVALNGSSLGGNVRVLVFGILEDAFFNFGINERLFLGINGAITTTEPTSGVLTCIGFGLGAGAIQIGIDKPVLL